jgi:hypothetical protein
MKTTRFLALMAISLAFFSVAAYAQGLSKKCVDELVAAQAKSKDVASFSKDLVTEVVKTKAQLKLPFGKPKDDKVTGIGVTVGCLKNFPETPDGVLATLKSVGLDALTGIAAGASLQPKTAVLPPPLPVLQVLAVSDPDKKCGEVEYDHATHGCKDGAVFTLPECGATHYNPETHGCALLVKCGTALYNSATHGCGKDGAVYPKCGETIYNPETYGCENNTVLAKCGSAFYNLATHGCSEDKAVLAKCDTLLYNAAVQKCENNAVVALTMEPAAPVVAVAEQAEEEQEDVRRFRFGIRAHGGPSMAEAFNFPGFGGGIAFMIPALGIYLVPEVSFAYRNVDIGSTDVTEMAVEVPVFFRFRYKKGNVVYFGIGPLFGLVLNSEVDGGYYQHYYSRESLDIGVATELGFRLGNHFNIDIRTLHSFTPDYDYYEYGYGYYGYSRYGGSSSSYLLQLQLGMTVLF